MRQRKNNFFNDDDVESGSDEEETIQAAHPTEEQGPKLLSRLARDCTLNSAQRFCSDFAEGKEWWVQCLTIIMVAILTYSYNNVTSHTPFEQESDGTNVQIAIMTIITLVGASPFCKTHLITAGIGAFVGGQNIIGAVSGQGEEEEAKVQGPSEVTIFSYLWLTLLGMMVGLVWCFIVTNPNLKLLDGCAGRLGTTTFIGMNITMLVVFGPANVVDWNRYWLGFVNIVHVGEEDSAPRVVTLSDAWKWSEEFELAIGYICAVVWLGVVAGGTRLWHNRHIQQWNLRNSSSDDQPPVPLNNVLIPVLWALLSMLAVNASGYKYASGLYNGFAVGSYVAMASLAKISTMTKFATISLIAAGWGLALTPVFVGFAGKSGFTSMMGHVTHIAIESFIARLRASRQQRHIDQQRQQEQQQQSQQFQSIEVQSLQQSDRPMEEHQQQTNETEPPPHLKPHKHLKRKDSLITKQQRRQQQRLQHQQPRSQSQEQQSQQERQTLLHHRAWSAAPKIGDGIWEHPLNTDQPTTTTTSASKSSSNSLHGLV